MTGIETEGELAGEIVCPEINLWAISKKGARVAAIRKFPHGHPVFILGERQGPGGETLYYVRDRKYMGKKGWATARFVIKDGEDSDVGATGVSGSRGEVPSSLH